MLPIVVCAAAAVIALASAQGKEKPGVSRAPFGRTADGKAVEIFTLTNRNGLEIKAITYGGIITSIRVPDRAGALGDVALGFDTLDGYLKGHPYFGAIVGRYGNRIAGGKFAIDGRTFTLATNNGPNHLHGGKVGFDKAVWSAEAAPASAGGAGIVLSHTSRDGDEGYPGTLRARVSYTLTDRNELVVEYHATTDKPTPINLTQHSYFNLAGGGDILDHELTINATRYIPVDATLIPTGELAPVEGTPFDFRKPAKVGARIDAAHEQVQRGGGYDHTFVLDGQAGQLRPAGRLVDGRSGRTLDVATTEPGMQFYSGNFLDGTLTGKGGQVYRRRAGLCLETQHFPDSPNKPKFPSTILRPGADYRSKTVFTFATIR